MIVAENLTKKFFKKKDQNSKKQSILAVDHINLEIKKGEILGIIGPNGAGKTTLLKMLSTLILPDEGTVTIDGYDLVKDSNIIKNNISLVSGEFVRSFYWRLSGRQNMIFFAKLRNIWDNTERVDELIELFNLQKHKNELVMKYSTGMKHKLAFAVALLNNPSVLFLDEPLTGIDPVTSFEIKSLIKDKFKDKTIIWTSHNLYEIEQMCDRIALINNGKIQMIGTPEELTREYLGYNKVLVISNNSNVFSSIKNAKIKDDLVEIETENVNKSFLEIMEIVKKNNVKIIDIKTKKPTLEDVFIRGIKHDK